MVFPTESYFLISVGFPAAYSLGFYTGDFTNDFDSDFAGGAFTDAFLTGAGFISTFGTVTGVSG